MAVVRSAERAVEVRGEALPTLQRLVDGTTGSQALTVLVNRFDGTQQVPPHVHDVEEVIVVVAGTCVLGLGDQEHEASTGDAVVVPPGTLHDIRHVGGGTATVVAVLASPDAPVGEPSGRARGAQVRGPEAGGG